MMEYEKLSKQWIVIFSWLLFSVLEIFTIMYNGIIFSSLQLLQTCTHDHFCLKRVFSIVWYITQGPFGILVTWKSNYSREICYTGITNFLSHMGFLHITTSWLYFKFEFLVISTNKYLQNTVITRMPAKYF